MIRKFLIIIFVSILLFSCGKKSDPIYNQESQNFKITNLKKNTLS